MYALEQLAFQGTECCPQYRWKQLAICGSRVPLDKIRNGQQHPENWRIVFMPCRIQSSNDFWMCICGVRAPTIQEAESFCAADAALHGGHVLGEYPVDLDTARACYDFDRADRWPVLGL